MRRFFAGPVLAIAVAVGAQTIPIANPSFEQHDAAWSLSAGAGARVEGDAADGDFAIGVTGTGEDTNYWRQDVAFEPNRLYALEFAIKKVSGVDGTPITGPAFCNRDLWEASSEWETVTSYFVSPDASAPETSWLRFGQWHLDGTVLYDHVQLWIAQPVYRRFGDIVLGEGEQVQCNRYEFEPTWASSLTNETRPLARHNCYFNTNRFVFGAGSYIVFHHSIAGRAQTSAEITLSTTHYDHASLHIEVSEDGEHWRPLASLTKDADRAVYAVLEPGRSATEVWIRLSAPEGEHLHQDSPLGSVTLGGYRYQTGLDGDPLDAVGATDYVRVRDVDPEITVNVVELGSGSAAGMVLEVTGSGERDVEVQPTLRVTHPEMEPQSLTTTLALRESPQRVEFAYDLSKPGRYEFNLSLGHDRRYHAEGHITVSDLFASHYGERLPNSTDDVGLWWASSGWKISQSRALPEAHGVALRMAAAQNEREAAQFVLSPAIELRELTMTAHALHADNGRTIDARHIEILRVHYLNVTRPTDASSVAAMWPDPLPPIDHPLDLLPGQNYPFWVRVFVPKGTPADTYRGAITLTARGYTSTVPIEVEVFGFELPDRPTCTSAFGFSPGNVFRYQNIADPESRRLVVEKYLRNFSEHRISPYDPAPMDEPIVTWPDVKPGDDVDAETLRVTIDWAPWDSALDYAFNELHFTSMRLPVAGMGGGTFHSRREPDLLGFTEDTPEYKALFTSYWSQMQEYLRAKGWLDKGYVYWFDEPDPKDYDFVMNGFRKLREAAPDLTRMLTEQVEDALIGGPNLWCPISNHYDHEAADARRAHGEAFWWYVCTGPKAPYATLFLDHPATEMRVWLWQTWQRGIDGVLVWQTNYWTSGAAYPDHPQNPYDDPMSWTSGYSTKAGQRLPWGNGDGRFVYPPLAAADANPAEPVLDGPVDSIRWEMLRDGIEDYEYLAILKRLIGEKQHVLSGSDREKLVALLDVPASITTTVTTFTNDPVPIEARRREIAAAIEALLEVD